ncbi:tRNA dimethylallyltransferase [Limimaricola soesokkakensis]|uniref:tRNA dimethylallyltransferase n=1 Tax=Limimaricola soesokkakensis TaxID=1343159 RepID=A0A1X6ZHH1_9RHOB|nr:tRNA (adenosine(37)-N6)-dimethylallyltransferase MiaA [Limimaricola soesokkakensis]PSK86047.1 tRNA dimethylallyltransferase [Limimaricola soesokkakensis]SLN51021.1 tRNA dimethylallyltransferase [Limimaricola soesokkakensis]
MSGWHEIARGLDPARPVLIAGPTASGKSALALAVAETGGGVVINADALQVYADWRVITARPSPDEEARAPHALYGHVGRDQTYSVGHWLRDVAPMLGGARPIITGGTGLYFSALTEGLAEIPATPPEIRAEANAIPLPDLVAGLDAASAAQIDLLNRARVQRAWEVLRATGRGIAEWQADTPAPLLPLDQAQPLVLRPEPAWLNARIARRFDAMLEAGALDEAREALPHWTPEAPWARAIGAPELIAHLRGETDLATAREAAIIASRQYAKRQRSWFRGRMREWREIDPAAPTG